MNQRSSPRFDFLVIALLLLAAISVLMHSNARAGVAASPQSASVFSDYKTQSPGRSHHITLQDLPQPFATSSADTPSEVVDRPENAWPKVPAGFAVQLYATGLHNPRLIRTAPNGDVFLAESKPGNIKILRGVDAKGGVERVETFATGLTQPFGIAFYPPGPEPQWVYVGNTDSVVRFPYRNGDLKARGEAQKICDLPGGGRLRGGGHWTRDIAFSLDGKTMFVSVGSHSNDDDADTHPEEKDRADILQFNPDGSGQKIFASGIRNAVGITVHPSSGELWASVNERDELGDNLVPDYITHVQSGGFYGWPWWYMGGVQDPQQKGKHPELKGKVITPDILVQPHNASLEMLFYGGKQFPAQYRGDIFAAEHGSWNRNTRTGYEVIRVAMHGGRRADGSYEDFMTGFVTPDGKVWGRPVGVAVAADGSLLVSDDGGEVVWRVSSNK